MSDVNISSPPAGPAPSAPSQGGSEVPVDTSPVHTPHPVGSQAPQKLVSQGADSSPAPSRRDTVRESIRKAFARTEEPPKAAGSQMGHNQPPEDKRLEKERVKTPPLDLKKPPSEQPRARGEHGHFAAGAPSPKSAPGRPQPGQIGPGQAAPIANPLPQNAPWREAPQRMARHARAEWHVAPESVRAEVHRMQREFTQSYERMRGDHEAMNRIRRFHDMAMQHGTTLEKALHNYVGMEEKLRSDPVGGLDVIINNLNLRTADGQRLGLRDVAWHVLNMTPEQHQLTQSQNSQTAQAQMLGQLRQQQEAIAHGLQQLHYERRFTHMRGQVDRFAETHPRLDELGKAIERELRFGFNLEAAYRRADALYPSTNASNPAAQTRAPSAQTRSAADRSIHGAPSGSGSSSGNGLNSGKRRRSDAPPSRRDTISHAIARVNGSSN
jgi:hypothetical protein